MNASSFSFAGWLLGWMVDYTILATVFLAALLLARRWIRQPAHRLTLAWIVTVELLVLAVVCAMPFWPRISLARAAASQEAAVAVDSEDAMLFIREAERLRRMPKLEPREFVPDDSVAALPSEPSETAAATVAAEPFPWLEAAAGAYLLGAGAVGLWLGWGAFSAGRIRRHARLASEPLHAELLRVASNGRAPRLLVSARIANAVAMGLVRPAILLPARLAETPSSESLRAVLTHEWAHVRRGDLWLLALGRCLLPLLFVHPLLWWLRRVIRDDQEWLADAEAAGEDRHAYAQTLLDLIRATAGPSPIRGAAAVAIWENPSQLARRIAMLLDDTFRIHPTGSPAWRRGALGVLVVVGVAFSFLTLQPARSADPAVTVATPEKQEGQPVVRPTADAKEQGGKKNSAKSAGLYDYTVHISSDEPPDTDEEEVNVSLPV
jgi:beta-lactamase regulating signal transducer with metallopeptidase domain